MPQPLPFAQTVFCRNQAQIATQLLAAGKAPGIADDEHVGDLVRAAEVREGFTAESAAGTEKNDEPGTRLAG